LVGVVAVCGWLLYCGIAATTRGHYLTTVVVVCWLAPVVAAFAVLVMTASGRTPLRANVDSGGTTLWPNPRATALLVAGFAVFVPGGFLFVVFAPQDALDLPMSRGVQIFMPIAMGLAVLLAVVGLAAVWRRSGIGHLTLGPAGVNVANILSTRSIDWQDVGEIHDHSETKKTRKAVVLCLRDGGEEVVEGLDLYVGGGTGLYWMVRHYWAHPDDRGELTDSRGLQRLDEGRFDLA
jgi:hypothetical protein